MRQGLLVVGTVEGRRPIVWRSVVKAWLPEVGSETFGGGPWGSARAWSIVLATRELDGGCKRCGCGGLFVRMLVACGPRGGEGGRR